MALSVLHLKSLYNDAACGVWSSLLMSYEFKGTYSECFDWKNQIERHQQLKSNLEYLSDLKAERVVMFGDKAAESLQ